MKAKESRQDEEPLRALLKEWKAAPTLPARFQEQVWRRIERSETPVTAGISLWVVLRNWITTMLPRPALAVSYLMVLLAIGATVGWAQARTETNRVGDQLSVRYVRSVDPYQPSR
jgi:glucose dehydrogenase